MAGESSHDGSFGLGPKGSMRIRALPMARALTARAHEVEMCLAPWGKPVGSGREGVRLGLAIARGIVRAHGGKIWAESKPGQGAKSIISLTLQLPS